MKAENGSGDIRYRELLDHLPVGVYRTTVDGRILECNQALATILGFENAEELKHLNVRQFYLHQEDRSAHQEQLSVHGTYFSEFQLLTSDKRLIWVRDFPRATISDQGEVLYYDGIMIDISELKQSEAAREYLIKNLQQALEKIRSLQELLPICSRCKKVRNDKGYWEAVEAYLHEHSNIKFSHAICPECAAVLYPELQQLRGNPEKE